MGKLKSIADDLSAFLRMSARTETKAPAPQTKLVQEQQVSALVRSAFDYVTSHLTEADGAKVIGEAFMVAAGAVAHDAGIDNEKARRQMVAFLEEIVDGAREGL